MLRPMSRGVVWGLRKDFRDYVRVSQHDNDDIHMHVDGQDIYCDRPTARLLAKRINDCLDKTVKK
jgi:hypothetical protein